MRLDFAIWLHGEAVQVPVPPVRQQTNYSCGAAALKAVAKYFGVGPEREGEYRRDTHADPEKGSTPRQLASAARQYGLRARVHTGMSLEQLRGFLDRRMPVIVAIQAWGNPRDYHKLEDGHYVVAIGRDSEGLIFEDPSMEGTRGRIAYEEFERRWHDREGDGTRDDRLGIVFWKDSPGAETSSRERAAEIR